MSHLEIIITSKGHILKYQNQDIVLFYCKLIDLFSILM